MIDGNEINQLIQKRMNIAEKDRSIDILLSYVEYLSDIKENDEILRYLRNELIPIMVFECVFGIKIYNIEDIDKFYKYHKKIVEREIQKVFLSSRSGMRLTDSDLQKLWDIFDIAFMIIRTHKFESLKVLRSWINDALRDIDGSLNELKNNDYQESLKRLQLGIEKLVKSYALYIGLKTEKELIKYKHTPSNVYIDLLKESWVPRFKDTLGLNTDINKNIQTLKNHQNSLKIGQPDIKNIEDFREKLQKWDKSTVIFLKNYKKINSKLNKVFKKKNIKYLVRFCNKQLRSDIEAFYYVWFTFSGLLLPLSFITYFYQSRFSYADYKRPLKINYKELILINNIKEIINLLNTNIDRMLNSIDGKQTLTYTLLCETIFYKINRISYFSSEEENIKNIEDSIERIKSNNYIKNLMKKLSNNKTISYTDFQFDKIDDTLI